MAKLKVMHKAAVLSTSLTAAQIRKAEALAPSSLQITDAEGSPVFKVAYGTHAFMSMFGVSFSDDSKVSVLLADEEEFDANKLEEVFGSILLSLTKVEQQVEEALANVNVELSNLIEIVE